uniref:Uncharacterized protein n=1 Tax=Arundo donax TaxID=35708 RepID=A0A0A9FUJ4_ARUDO
MSLFEKSVHSIELKKVRGYSTGQQFAPITLMHLKFKVDQKGSDVAEHCCSFESKLHGCASHHLLYIRKVTWSTLIE